MKNLWGTASVNSQQKYRFSEGAEFNHTRFAKVYILLSVVFNTNHTRRRTGTTTALPEAIKLIPNCTFTIAACTYMAYTLQPNDKLTILLAWTDTFEPQSLNKLKKLHEEEAHNYEQH